MTATAMSPSATIRAERLWRRLRNECPHTTAMPHLRKHIMKIITKAIADDGSLPTAHSTYSRGGK